VAESSERSAKSSAMPAFDWRCARRIFGEIEDDTEPVADMAYNLKIGRINHAETRCGFVASKQSRQAEYNRLTALPGVLPDGNVRWLSIAHANDGATKVAR
jgi:hypothetical protein